MIGIYKIESKINNRVYIGLSTNIERRWYKHKNELRQNKHHNIHLQSAYNKYGIEAFTHTVLELCDKEILGDKEIAWADYYRNELGMVLYNIAECGGKLGIGKDHSKYDPTLRTFYHLDGRIEKNITQYTFRKKYKGLQIAKLLGGVVLSSNGWYLDKDEMLLKQQAYRHTYYHIDGKVEENVTRRYMTDKYNLNPSSICELVNGEWTTTKGWFVDKKKMLVYKASKFKDIIHTDNTIIFSITRVKFAELTGRSKTSAKNLFSGKSKTVEGWSLYNKNK